MIDKIYVISKGEYSDYRVLAVFENKETAEKWKSAMNEDSEYSYDQVSIEEMPFISKDAEPAKIVTYRRFADLHDNRITIDRDRESNTTSWCGIDAYDGVPTKRPSIRYVRAPMHNNQAGRLEVVGSDKAHVDKAFQDRVRMWKAGQFGGPQHSEIIEEGSDDVAV